MIALFDAIGVEYLTLIRVGDRSAGIISFLPDEPGGVRSLYLPQRAGSVARAPSGDFPSWFARPSCLALAQAIVRALQKGGGAPSRAQLRTRYDRI